MDGLDQGLIELVTRLTAQSAERRLRTVIEAGLGDLVLTTSFGLEDQALTHMIMERRLPVRFVTLDTGRLFPETYEVWERTEARYGLKIAAFTPEAASVAELVATDGVNGFHRTVTARERCCDARKLAPLARALAGAGVWVSGLRAEQSPGRSRTPILERDARFGLLKLNPILDWSRERLVDFIAVEEIPYNPLHDQGFASIGCAPCTRALKLGEPERAGRWWWEENGAKECGLHAADPARLDAVLA